METVRKILYIKNLFNAVFLSPTGPQVIVGLTETTFSTQEGGQVTICTQIKEGSAPFSRPLVVTIQTGHTGQLVGSKLLVKTDTKSISH